MRRLLASVLILLGASSGAEAVSAKDYPIVMDKMRFGPAPSGLRVGDTIVWINRDLFRHTASARDKSFDVDLPPGKMARTRLSKPGTIAFFCRFHPGMKGQLVIAR
jgi:plastocyanin